MKLWTRRLEGCSTSPGTPGTPEAGRGEEGSSPGTQRERGPASHGGAWVPSWTSVTVAREEPEETPGTRRGAAPGAPGPFLVARVRPRPCCWLPGGLVWVSTGKPRLLQSAAAGPSAGAWPLLER